MKTSIFLIGLFLMLILIVVMPIATIWSLNVLFPVLNIKLTFETWLAAFFLASIIGSHKFTNKYEDK